MAMFDYPYELHCSQTLTVFVSLEIEFDYPYELHCSQTLVCRLLTNHRLTILMNYIALKQARELPERHLSLTILMNYIALKRC